MPKILFKKIDSEPNSGRLKFGSFDIYNAVIFLVLTFRDRVRDISIC